MEFIIENSKLVEIKNPEQDIYIPEGVKSLGHDVFNCLEEAKNIWFPKSLVDCRGARVLLFRNQENIFVHQENPVYSSYDGVLYNKDLTVLICCPMGKKGIYKLAPTTKSIAEDAFCCSSLEELILNEGLESIEQYAFADSNINHWIFIPESVSHIDKDAFAGEWSNQCILVVKGSYAHHYAKQKDSSVWRYRCIPQHGEIVWNEHEWLFMFEQAKFHKDYDRLRSLRKDVFQSTLATVERGEYMTAHGHIVRLPLTGNLQNKTRFYDKEIHPKVAYSTRYNTQIAAVNDDCLNFARRIHKIEKDVCVLNMASRRNPGGGVFAGAGAQEEYLFRCSDYYRSLYQYAPFAVEYGMKESSHSYPLDRNYGGCFSPGVTVFRGTEEDGYRFLHHPWHMNFIAVPGMNRPELVHLNNEVRIAHHLIEGVKNKIRTIFRIAVDNGQKTLILGALGCGAFKNPPKHVAELFKEVLCEPEFIHVFRRVFFVIKEDHNSTGEGNFKPFKEIFGCIGNKESLTPEPQLVLSNCKRESLFSRLITKRLERDAVAKGAILHQESFGRDFTWRIYSDGVLEISGMGRMPDYVNHWDSYTGEGQAPWIGCDKYGIMPYKLIICEGISYIGSNAFESFGCLREIILPQSLLIIGKMAFFDCFNVERINIPHQMDIAFFDIAELPLYYNNDYRIIGDEMVRK